MNRNLAVIASVVVIFQAMVPRASAQGFPGPEPATIISADPVPMDSTAAEFIFVNPQWWNQGTGEPSPVDQVILRWSTTPPPPYEDGGPSWPAIAYLDWFAHAAYATPQPAPGPPGSFGYVTVTGLPPAATSYFAIQCVAGGMWGRPGQSMEVTTSDDWEPPAPIDTFAFSSATASSLTWTWTATGDDGSVGQAHHYSIHYSTVDPDSVGLGAWLQDATEELLPPAPLPAGEVQTWTKQGLGPPGSTWWFAIEAFDEVQNKGDVRIASAPMINHGQLLISDPSMAGKKDAACGVFATAGLPTAPMALLVVLAATFRRIFR